MQYVLVLKTVGGKLLLFVVNNPLQGIIEAVLRLGVDIDRHLCRRPALLGQGVLNLGERVNARRFRVTGVVKVYDLLQCLEIAVVGVSFGL